MSEPINEVEQLQQTVQQLKAELDNLKHIVANPTPLSADAYPALLTNSAPTHQILDIPLAKVTDLYRECPQVLEAHAQRAALDQKHFSLSGVNGDQPLTFHANPNGNFWVIQLQNQGYYLFPRPQDFKHIHRLSYLDKLFIYNQQNKQEKYEFDLLEPAKLKVIKLSLSWNLDRLGKIDYGEAPLRFQWQKKIQSLISDCQKLNQEYITIAKNFQKLESLISDNHNTFSKIIKDFDIKIKEQQGKTNDVFHQIDKIYSQLETQKKISAKILFLSENKPEKNISKSLMITSNLSEELGNSKSEIYCLQNHLQITTNPEHIQTIEKFNQRDLAWFRSKIRQSIFRRIILLDKSANGYDNQCYELKIDDNGNFLLYQVAEIDWIVPNLAKFLWRGIATRKLFVGKGNYLVYPAQVAFIEDNRWQVIQKGEFQA